MARKTNGSASANVTSHDVARVAGVSQSTVSRALRGDSRVAVATQERIRAAAEQLGYVPSALGRSLSTRSTGGIGLVVTDLTNPFYPHVLAPLHDALQEESYRMVLFAERGVEDSLFQQLSNQSIDGVVLATTLLSSSTMPLELYRRGIPFVFITRTADGVLADCAIVDNALGASIMGAELLRLGHRRIGAIFGDEDTSTSRDRERGLRAALSAGGVDLDDALIRRGSFTFETGSRFLPEIVDVDPPPTAVFCGNDSIAIGVLDAAHSLGIGIPDQLSVVGFDDLPMAAWDMFQLTTIHQPLEEMARTAAKLIVERIRALPNELAPRRIVFEPQLVRRRTLAPPAS